MSLSIDAREQSTAELRQMRCHDSERKWTSAACISGR